MSGEALRGEGGGGEGGGKEADTCTGKDALTHKEGDSTMVGGDSRSWGGHRWIAGLD